MHNNACIFWLGYVFIQGKSDFNRCTAVFWLRLSLSFALAELSSFRENLILKGSSSRNIPG